MQFRFKIKTILIFIALVAMVVLFIQHWRFENKWSDIRGRVVDWSNKLKDTNEKTGFVGSARDRNGDTFFFAIANAPIQLENRTVKFPRSTVEPPPNYRYFVEPPGVWVPDIESAILLWSRY